MSTDLLRQAATMLRERAEKATPGPWYWEPESRESWPQGDQSLMSSGQKMRTADGTQTEWDDTVLVGWGYDASGIEGRGEDRTYIATMHPGVGLALAEWLDDHAHDHDAYDCGWHTCSGVALARLIVGDS